MKLFHVPVLSRGRIGFSLVVAIAADALQFALGPFGWAFADQLIDILAMGIISAAVGFHPLFLPTFVAEFIPGIDMLPSWAGCTLFVTMRRWKQQQAQAPPPPPSTSSGPPVIDI